MARLRPQALRWFRCTPLTVAIVLLSLPAAATGDVLVNAVEPSTVACGKSIKLGVWYQSFSGGPRWARITIRKRHGPVVWRKRVTATTTWQYWRYKGNCGRRYVAIYQIARGTFRFPFRVKKPADLPSTSYY